MHMGHLVIIFSIRGFCSTNIGLTHGDLFGSWDSLGLHFMNILLKYGNFFIFFSCMVVSTCMLPPQASSMFRSIGRVSISSGPGLADKHIHTKGRYTLCNI